LERKRQKCKPLNTLSGTKVNAANSSRLVSNCRNDDRLKNSNKNYPTRIECSFNYKDGQVVLDQIRSVDKIRLTKKLGENGHAN
jgi:mRNA interferase MazF